jgi:hypothetical protein
MLLSFSIRKLPNYQDESRRHRDGGRWIELAQNRVNSPVLTLAVLIPSVSAGGISSCTDRFLYFFSAFCFCVLHAPLLY